MAGGWFALLIVLAGLLAYSNSFRGPFIFDDWGAIEGNGTIRDLGNVPAVFSAPPEQPTAGRPLVNLSFAINYALDGLDVRGYHAANLAFHLCCALLIFGIVRRTLALPCLHDLFGAQATPLAFAVALLWLLHPLNTEVVDYVSQRTESLMALFYLLTLYSSIREIEPRGTKWRVAAFLSCAAGMASKESMVTAPVAVILYDLSFRFGSIREAWQSRKRLYLTLISTWGLLVALMWSGPRVLTAGFSTSVTLWTYLLNQAVMLVHYLRLAVWPRDLVLNYGRPVSLTLQAVAPYALLMVALVLLTIVLWATRRSLGFLGVWFFMTLAPTTLVPIATEVGAERRMYLPVIALIVLAVLGLFAAGRRLRAASGPAASSQPGVWVGLVAVVVVSTGFGAAVISRNREYRSALSMSQTILARWPSGVADAMVGVASGEAGLHEAAIAHFRDAVSHGNVQAHYSLAAELFGAGKLDEAIDHLQQLLGRRNEVDRGMIVQAQRMLADAWLRRREFDRASAAYTAYLVDRPNDVDAIDNLGLALATSGRYREAAEAFRRLVALAPNNTEAWSNMVAALLDAGDLTAAEQQARNALLIQPDDPTLMDLLGRAERLLQLRRR